MRATKHSVIVISLCCLALATSGCKGLRPAAAARLTPLTPTIQRPTPPKTVPGPERRVISPGVWRQEALTWIGAPYLYGGTGRDGVDCSGLVMQLYRAVAGIQLPRSSQDQYYQGEAVHPNDLAPGDLVFFKIKGGGVDHVGLSLGGHEFVHASSSKGVIITSLQEPYYASRFYGAKRIIH